MEQHIINLWNRRLCWSSRCVNGQGDLSCCIIAWMLQKTDLVYSATCKCFGRQTDPVVIFYWRGCCNNSIITCCRLATFFLLILVHLAVATSTFFWNIKLKIKILWDRWVIFHIFYNQQNEDYTLLVLIFARVNFRAQRNNLFHVY